MGQQIFITRLDGAGGGGGTEITDHLHFTSTGLISTESGDLTIQPATNKAVKFGSSFVSSHDLDGDPYVGINWNLEVNEHAYFDKGVTIAGATTYVKGGAKFQGASWTSFEGGGVSFYNGIEARFGHATNKSGIKFNTAQTVDTTSFAVDPGSKTLLVCNYGHANTDFGFSAESVPTLRIASDPADATKSVAHRHNGTDGECLSYKGGMLNSAPSSAPTTTGPSQVAWYLDETGDNLKAVVKYSNGTTVKTATVALA